MRGQHNLEAHELEERISENTRQLLKRGYHDS